MNDLEMVAGDAVGPKIKTERLSDESWTAASAIRGEMGLLSRVSSE